MQTTDLAVASVPSATLIEGLHHDASTMPTHSCESNIYKPSQDEKHSITHEQRHAQPAARQRTDEVKNRSATDPRNLARSYRLLLLCLLTLCASIDPMASTSFYPALVEVSETFQTSKAVANLCSSLDFAGVASTALYWSYASQRSGRKPILVIGLALVALFTVLGAVAGSIGMLIAARLLSSASAAGIIITGVGAVGDMWEVREKGFAMGVYFAGPLASPALGPVLGGLLSRKWGWRAIPCFIAALAGVLLVAVLFFLPETKAATLSKRKQRKYSEADAIETNVSDTTLVEAQRGGADSARAIEKAARPAGCVGAVPRGGLRALVPMLYRPLFALGHLRYLMVVLLLSIAAFSYCLTSIFSVTMQSVFSSPPYNYNTLIIGLLFLPYAFGTIAASLVGGKLSDWMMRRQAERSSALRGPKGRSGSRLAREEAAAAAARVFPFSHTDLSLPSSHPATSESSLSTHHPAIGPLPSHPTATSTQLFPENRIRSNALAASALQILSLPAFGWAVHVHAPWWAMLPPALMLGASCGLNLGIATTVLVELIPTRAAELIALNSLGRNLAGAVGGSVVQPLIDGIGTGWLYTGLCGIGVLSAGMVFAAMVRGRRWRERIWSAEKVACEE